MKINFKVVAMSLAIGLFGLQANAQTDSRMNDVQDVNQITVEQESKTISPKISKEAKSQNEKTFSSKTRSAKNLFSGKRTAMGTGLKLILGGLLLIIVALIVGILAVGSLSGGLLIVASLLYFIGGLAITVGLIVWIIELVS